MGDYKFYTMGGHIAAVAIIAHRGTDDECHTWRDEHWNRLDRFGCFSSNGADLETAFCSDFAPPGGWDEMVKTAKRLSQRIGIFFRIDLFQNEDGTVMLGEFTPFPASGNFYCAAY